VTDGAVTLSGEVESYPEKSLAEKAAQRVRGVIAIAEEIGVRDTWGAADTDIAREASEALRRAVDVPDTVKATVHGRVVTLSGVVEWQYQRAAAARAVCYLKGVRTIINAVTIRPTAVAADIKATIGAAIARNARLENQHIAVTTGTAGAVTLEGTVHSWAQRRQAEHAAWSAPGVTAVTNHLRIDH
ncbi:MAG: BON domain-containing protein, partial [Mycobacteriaceae bacterium]